MNLAPECSGAIALGDFWAGKNLQRPAWCYTDKARLRGLKNKVEKRPQAEAWCYRDKARLRGLKNKGGGKTSTLMGRG